VLTGNASPPIRNFEGNRPRSRSFVVKTDDGGGWILCGEVILNYSIASAPNLDKRFELTIERLANDEVSPYLIQEVAVGDRLELLGPIGGWFVWRKEQTEAIQLVAGGSGIVPLTSMIRSRAPTQSSFLPG
jgi:ferredoxin-NADP reductase